MTDQHTNPRLGAYHLKYDVEGIANFYDDGTAGFTCGACKQPVQLVGRDSITMPSTETCPHCFKRNLL